LLRIAQPGRHRVTRPGGGAGGGPPPPPPGGPARPPRGGAPPRGGPPPPPPPPPPPRGPPRPAPPRHRRGPPGPPPHTPPPPLRPGWAQPLQRAPLVMDDLQDGGLGQQSLLAGPVVDPGHGPPCRMREHAVTDRIAQPGRHRHLRWRLPGVGRRDLGAAIGLVF